MDLKAKGVRAMFGPSQRETLDHFKGVLLGKNPNATMRALVNGIEPSDGLISAVGNFVVEPWQDPLMDQWVFGLIPKGIAFVPIGPAGTAKPRHTDTRFLSFSVVTAVRYFTPRIDDDPNEHLEFETWLPPDGPGYRFQMYVPDFPVSRALLRTMVKELSECHAVPAVVPADSSQPAPSRPSTASEPRGPQTEKHPELPQTRVQRNSRLGIRRPR